MMDEEGLQSFIGLFLKEKKPTVDNVIHAMALCGALMNIFIALLPEEIQTSELERWVDILYRQQHKTSSAMKDIKAHE